MNARHLSIGAVLCATVAAAPSAHATTITFDSTITSPNPPVVDGANVAFEYTSPAPPTLPTALVTQGFDFGGFTNGISSNHQVTLAIVADAANCPSITGGTACVSDGSHYLVASNNFAMIPQVGGAFSIASIDASQVWPSGSCPGCDPSDQHNITNIEVTGFLNGAIVAQQLFDLSTSFQTFALTAPGFEDVARIVFSTTGPQGVGALDNIVVGPAVVPEPATLTLLATGLAAAYRWRKRRTVA